MKHDLLTLLGKDAEVSNENLPSTVTPEEALIAGYELAEAETAIAQSFESYDLLAVAESELTSHQAKLSNENQDIAQGAADSIATIANIIGLKKDMIDSPESIAEFAVSVAKSGEVVLTQIMAHLTKWIESMKTAITAQLGGIPMLLAAANTITNSTYLNASSRVLTAAASFREPSTWFGSTLEVDSKVTGFLSKWISSKSYHVSNFAKETESVSVSTAKKLLNGCKKIDKAIVTRMGGGKYGVLGWNTSMIDWQTKAQLTYFKTTAIAKAVPKSGRIKASELKISGKMVASQLGGFKTIQARIKNNAENISNANREYKDALSDAKDKADAIRIKNNLIATVKYLSDKTVSELALFNDAKAIVRSIADND